MRSLSILRKQDGQAMVELAFVLPILIMVMLGIVQFGIVFNNYVTLTDAARAGARRAAVSRQDPNRDSAVITAVKNSASDLDLSKLSVPPPVSTWDPGSDVTVTASYPYSISLLGLVVKSGSLTTKTTERVE
jgi:Flp pilus assembly protein TadG